MERIPGILIWGAALLLYGCTSYDDRQVSDSDEATLSTSPSASIFETAAESKERRTRVMSDSLRQSLKQLPGVADVRVHLTLEDTSILSKLPREKAGAAVLVVPMNETPPDTAAIREFTVAAVPGLSPDAVRVFVGAPKSPPEKLVSVGAFQVAEHSAAALKTTLAALLILCLLTAFALIVAGIRIRKLRSLRQ